jgi:transposase-like protein
MNTTETNPEITKPPKRRWRKHSDEFKARVVAQALQPHASLASVALANGINANMLRRWAYASSPANAPSPAIRDDRNAQALSFVQLPVQIDKPTPTAPASATSTIVQVQIHRGETTVVVSLPMMGDSAAWVREVLS